MQGVAPVLRTTMSRGYQQARGGTAGCRDRVAGEDLISSKHRLENISARVDHQAGVTLGYPPARPLIFPETGAATVTNTIRGFSRMGGGCWCRYGKREPYDTTSNCD